MRNQGSDFSVYFLALDLSTSVAGLAIVQIVTLLFSSHTSESLWLTIASWGSSSAFFMLVSCLSSSRSEAGLVGSAVF